MAIRGIVVSSLVAAMLGASVAHAATPTPSSTATPTPTATPTATLPPAGQPMQVVGTGWIDARPSGEDVHAFIGGVDCASSGGRIGTGGPFFVLNIPAASQRPGCGVAGATITFTVGGRAASTTLTWHAGGAAATQIVVGPPFALYYGKYPVFETLASPVDLVPLIEGRACGVELGGGPGPADGIAAFDVVVDPEALRPGCGRPGSVVHFELRAGDVLLARARETGIWQPMVFRELNLTFVPVAALPATGAGQPATSTSRQHVAFALTAAGIACIVAGWRGRRRGVGGPAAHRRASSASGP